VICKWNQQDLCSGYPDNCHDCEQKTTWTEQVNEFLIEQKMRFDLSSTFISAVNFIMLSVITMTQVFRITDKFQIGGLAILSFGLLWLFGYIIDAKLKYLQHIQTMQFNRNPQLVKIQQDIKTLLERKRG
jgi:hypothetical protein